MPLDLAAKDNFSGVRKIVGLGIALRAACDGLIAKVAQVEPNEALVAWRERLAGWEQLGEMEQQVEVARGMRLMARYPTRPRAVVKTGPSVASLLPPVPTPHAPASPAPPVAAPPISAPAKSTLAFRPSPAAAPAKSSSAPAPSASPKSKRAPKVDDTLDPMALPTHTLPGIGPAFAERLAEKGLETVEDLLWCLPRRYDDVRDARQLADVAAMAEGERATFVAKVASSRMVFVRRRRWAEVRLSDLELRASAVVRWFNVWAGIEKRMPPGAIVTVSGVVRFREGRLEFANPDILAIDLAPDQIELGTAPKKAMPKLIARYPEVAGVPASKLRAACQTACARVGASADDGVPASVERAASLPALSATLAMLHAPPDDIAPTELAALNHHTSVWQKRLVFGELFALGVAVALKRRERRADAAMPCARSAAVDAAIAAALPFAPTRAQKKTIAEIADDLAKREPMNRLLQGDVGSGKTAVAFAAAVQVARAGRQTAIMAPTELLAEQHHETWKAWAERAQLKVALLTASTPKAVRQSLLAMLAQRQIASPALPGGAAPPNGGAGSIDILIGTHALLAEGVGFGALGLVVIDEQHRFGVAQRAKLRDKGDGQGAPHLLVMTATPIPRTLALTAYGDLDVSVLDELPPGRKPVQTTLVAGKRGETAAYKLVAQRIGHGERAYIVCPKVEDDNEDSDWKDATTVATEVAALLPHAKVGLVHGRLDAATRDRVMRAFKVGELDVLVATTVIEVGVDIPDATVMVIHDADRFGLAQLHQLRGRVGRGGAAAHCYLVTHGGLTEDGRERLDAMVRTTDGFQIAETDLALRGPGELCGPRQAGVPRLRYGDLGQHFELLLEARHHAARILDEDPDLVRPEHTALRAALARRLAQSVYGAESG